MALVPQVVDAVSPIPVVASGGIFDGRGIAAALMLGAVGVNLGTAVHRLEGCARLRGVEASNPSRQFGGFDQGRGSQRYQPGPGRRWIRHGCEHSSIARLRIGGRRKRSLVTVLALSR